MAFTSWQHYHKQANTAGLTPIEIKLLYTFWSQFTDDKQLKEALHNPGRLVDAAANSTVRSSLSALTIASISDTLMKTIESCHEETLSAYQIVDYLNSLLNDDDGVPDKAEEEAILNVLALTSRLTKDTDQYVDGIATTRYSLNEAVNYGHLLGRFLTKRLRKHNEGKDSLL